jgi:hypothetical protein
MLFVRDLEHQGAPPPLEPHMRLRRSNPAARSELDCFAGARNAGWTALERHQMCQAGVFDATSERTVRYEHYHDWA